jgi:hypothetical protein
MEILIGDRQVYSGWRPFGISVADRRSHIAIFGKTGSGKTTLLRSLLVQDIEAGRGCMLLDPHGDLADELLDHIPPWRTEDLIYFSPADLSHPIGLNLLERVPADDRPLVASSVVSTFKHLWADSWGPRLEYILYNTVAALLDFPKSRGGMSLLAVPRMLSDSEYRLRVTRHIQDARVRAFWEQEFARFSPQLTAEAVSPIQNKVGALLSAPAVRNVLGQATSTLRLGKAMDEQRIIICNLAKGRIGEDKANLLGSMLVTGVQLAAMARASVPEHERIDFVCYLDEFHNFATTSFASILSEGRKYGLALVTANQFLAQVDPRILAALFGNVGTLVSFQVGHTDAEELAPEFSPYSREILGDLRRGEVCVRTLRNGEPGAPFLGRTWQIAGKGYENRRNLIQQSRRRYGRRRQEVELALTEWMAPPRSSHSHSARG